MRDVDFDRQSVQVNASYTHGSLDVPKSGRGRSVPLIDSVASVLAKLGQRDHLAGPDDLVFVLCASTTAPHVRHV